jgi:PAS domain S-box-containing protein
MGMWEWDIKNDRTTWNEKEFELLGLPPIKGPVDANLFIGHVHPDERNNFNDIIQSLLENGAEYRNEFRIVRADKQIRWLNVVGKLYRDENGKPRKLIGVNFDVTNRKLMEDGLMRKARELDAVNKEIEAFSHSLSHDLRGPLRAITGFSSILFQDHAHEFSPDAREFLGHIANSAKKIDHLIDDMLTLSNISRQEIRREEIDLSFSAQTILDELSRKDPQRSVAILIAPDLKVHGDPGLIHIALSNLFGNAWKYSSKTPNARIEFEATQSGETKVYIVRDNGAGFNMDHADGLFEPFRRLHSDSEFQGTGVGLAIVKRVIEKHGGLIWARSEPGKGAAFHFALSIDKNRAFDD